MIPREHTAKNNIMGSIHKIHHALQSQSLKQLVLRLKKRYINVNNYSEYFQDTIRFDLNDENYPLINELLIAINDQHDLDLKALLARWIIDTLSPKSFFPHYAQSLMVEDNPSTYSKREQQQAYACLNYVRLYYQYAKLPAAPVDEYQRMVAPLMALRPDLICRDIFQRIAISDHLVEILDLNTIAKSLIAKSQDIGSTVPNTLWLIQIAIKHKTITRDEIKTALLNGLSKNTADGLKERMLKAIKQDNADLLELLLTYIPEAPAVLFKSGAIPGSDYVNIFAHTLSLDKDTTPKHRCLVSLLRHYEDYEISKKQEKPHLSLIDNLSQLWLEELCEVLVLHNQHTLLREQIEFNDKITEDSLQIWLESAINSRQNDAAEVLVNELRFKMNDDVFEQTLLQHMSFAVQRDNIEIFILIQEKLKRIFPERTQLLNRHLHLLLTDAIEHRSTSVAQYLCQHLLSDEEKSQYLQSVVLSCKTTAQLDTLQYILDIAILPPNGIYDKETALSKFLETRFHREVNRSDFNMQVVARLLEHGADFTCLDHPGLIAYYEKLERQINDHYKTMPPKDYCIATKCLAYICREIHNRVAETSPPEELGPLGRHGLYDDKSALDYLIQACRYSYLSYTTDDNVDKDEKILHLGNHVIALERCWVQLCQNAQCDDNVTQHILSPFYNRNDTANRRQTLFKLQSASADLYQSYIELQWQFDIITDIQRNAGKQVAHLKKRKPITAPSDHAENIELNYTRYKLWYSKQHWTLQSLLLLPTLLALTGVGLFYLATRLFATSNTKPSISFNTTVCPIGSYQPPVMEYCDQPKLIAPSKMTIDTQLEAVNAINLFAKELKQQFQNIHPTFHWYSLKCEGAKHLFTLIRACEALLSSQLSFEKLNQITLLAQNFVLPVDSDAIYHEIAAQNESFRAKSEILRGYSYQENSLADHKQRLLDILATAKTLLSRSPRMAAASPRMDFQLRPN